MTRPDNRHGQTIALFDLDGTLTHSDSMLAFTRFVCGDLTYVGGLIRLLPMLLKYRFGKLDHTTAKIRWLTYFLGGKTEKELEEAGARFAETKLPQLLRPAAMERLNWHQSQTHMCFLVTASLETWTRAWANKSGLILVASKGEIKHGIFTGRLIGNNCWGEEKRQRVEAILPSTEINKIYAYGDSSGDKAILQWADEAHFRPFR